MKLSIFYVEYEGDSCTVAAYTEKQAREIALKDNFGEDGGIDVTDLTSRLLSQEETMIEEYMNNDGKMVSLSSLNTNEFPGLLTSTLF